LFGRLLIKEKTLTCYNGLMTVNKPRTIDNLGIDTSIRYAKDQELLKDVRLIEESRWVAPKSEITVTKPYIPSEYDQLFSAARTAAWASFAPPPGYDAMARAIFSYQLIPSLGTPEEQEADNEKLGRDKEDNEDGEQQRETLEALFQCIEKFDKTLTLINSRRNQYQRG